MNFASSPRSYVEHRNPASGVAVSRLFTVFRKIEALFNMSLQLVFFALYFTLL